MNIKMVITLVMIIYMSSIVSAENQNDVDNGKLNIKLDNNTPLLHNVKLAQITIVKVENSSEKIFWKDNITLPFNSSFSVSPGTYKMYIKRNNNSIIEYNNDSEGYIITPGSTVNIPKNLAIEYRNASIQYANTAFKDVLSDAPWRINKGENIPITYIIKDANQWSAYFRTITIYDDDEPIGSESGDTLVYTHPLWQTFSQDLWYGYDILSPSLFNEQDDYLEIHVKFDIAWEFDEHSWYTIYMSPYKLPYLQNWYYGDTHYHSWYTDNVVEFGAPIESTKLAGKAVGLNWITVTDHSFDLDQNKWNNIVSDSTSYSTSDFRILPSEEISCKVQGPTYTEYNHYLAYGITNFIPGGEWEDGTGSNYNCPELVSIVNNQGGFGYPAHPINNDEFREPWQDYSLNFKGLEIWNGENDRNLDNGLNKWIGLLLNGRKIFIEGGSDAHGDFKSGFGRPRTVVYASSLSNDKILTSLKNGHSIMTNGPMIVFNISGTIIGNTLNILKGTNAKLNIQWRSTQEFGEIYRIDIIKGNIGGSEAIEKTIYPNSYSGSYYLNIIPTQKSYYRLFALTTTGYKAYTNPIWINIITETRITTNAANQYNPMIYGNRIVYSDNRNGNLDIYMYNLSINKEKRITTNTAHQLISGIYGNRIAYSDNRNGNADIYMYDLSTNTEKRITTNTANQQFPVIYGNRIAWQDQRNGNEDVYIYDLSTNTEKRITTNTANQYDPSIYGNRIVYTDDRNGIIDTDVYMYDLSTNTEKRITTNTSNQHSPTIYGNRIVWEDYRNSKYESDIYMYNISVNKEKRITTNTSGQHDPAIYGDRIVYIDDRNGNYDIYTYDLSTNTEKRITTNTSGQHDPAIYGNRIVWQDWRNNNADIYMYII